MKAEKAMRPPARFVQRPGIRAVVVLALGILALTEIAAVGGFGHTTGAQAQEQQAVRYGPRQAMSQAPCGPDDAPETDLQGRVPPQDLLTGRAFQPYNCNLELVGNFPSSGYASFDTYEDCAYWGRNVAVGGVQVLDVSDPTSPLPTATLTTPAMLDPWESLRVHAGRGLLVADSQVHGWLDVYDVSEDCRQPQLLSTTFIGLASGHEGWLSPDGMTYYMSTGVSTGDLFGPNTVFPVDISDPTNPQVLAEWAFEHQTHGGWTTEDGTLSLICQQMPPPDDKLLIVDTTEVASREPDPQPKVIATIPMGDNKWCQNAYRVTYDGHPYLIVFGEAPGADSCARAADGWATSAYPRFYDLADERNPVHVSDALLEVQLPEHCEEVQGEGVLVNQFGYGVHYCSPDRIYDPTILACAWFGSGLRVLDIRDPHNPKELGYFNPGMPTGLTGAAPRPVVRADLGQIWFVTSVGGFHAVEFRDGVWPFESSARCPEFPDFWFAHYNPTSRCTTASREGVGRPAPGDADPAGPPSEPPPVATPVEPGEPDSGAGPLPATGGGLGALALLLASVAVMWRQRARSDVR